MRTRLLGIVLSLLAAALMALAPAALAHHKDGHDQGGGSTQSPKDNDGDADSDPGTSFTEDNDTNDGGTPNNVSDEGDNRHPSGKDRSVEKGGSGNQGKSESDPDGISNGGPDKPNGSGGDDLADQDGNNGCGNDDDFEDDNNGNCGKPEGPDVLGASDISDSFSDSLENLAQVVASLTSPEADFGTDALGETVFNAVPAEVDQDDIVLGVQERAASGAPSNLVEAASPAAAPGSLPLTGGAVTLAWLGLGLLLAGAALIRRSSSRMPEVRAADNS